MKNKKIFYINLIYYISLLLVAIVFVLGHLNILKSDFISTLILQLVIISGIPLILYSLLVSKSIKQTFNDFGFKKLSKKLLIISICLALVLYFLNIFIANAFNSVVVLLGYDTTIPALTVSNGTMLKEFFLTACLPGLCEEVIHRGMMLNGCKKQGYTRYGLIFSSILFGLMHLNILQFFYACILGFLMGFAVLTTESIWTGVIIHFTNNFLSVYFSLDKNLPFHNLYDYIIDGIYKFSIPFFIFFVTILVFVLLKAYKDLITASRKTVSQEKIKKICKELQIETLSEEEAQLKIDMLNQTLTNLNKTKFEVTDTGNLSFLDKVFLYSSLILGSLGTIFTFICGIL